MILIVRSSATALALAAWSVFLTGSGGLCYAEAKVSGDKTEGASVIELVVPSHLQIEGVLGRAIDAGRRGRLRSFIVNEQSPPVAVFSKVEMSTMKRNHWYGEHAGKWLMAASRAASLTGDKELLARARGVADYLISMQEADGYLGNYLPEERMTAPDQVQGASWDVWIHAYLILGFLELNKVSPDARYLEAATRIGDLCARVFGPGGKSLIDQSNHLGLSATVLMEPLVELYLATGNAAYLDMANRVVAQIQERAESQIVSRALGGLDAEVLGDGKAYQLLWNFVGLAKLCAVTRNADYLKATHNFWENVRAHHLTPGGGPWGGIGKHKECFNRVDFFDPSGLVETCSTMAWIHLNRELLRQTGEAKYAEEMEKSFYNALLGACYPNGEDWNYFVMDNGPRHLAVSWDCCKSSGALALEEIPGVIFGRRAEGLAVNIYAPCSGEIEISSRRRVQVKIVTEYPNAGAVDIVLKMPHPGEFPLYVRIPAWAGGAIVRKNGQAVPGSPVPGSYMEISGPWHGGDTVSLEFPMKLRTVRQDAVLEHRENEVARQTYLAVCRGPLVYATGQRQSTEVMDTLGAESLAAMPETTPSAGTLGTAYALTIPSGTPMVFVPYYEAGGREPGTWRYTWLRVH